MTSRVSTTTSTSDAVTHRPYELFFHSSSHEKTIHKMRGMKALGPYLRLSQRTFKLRIRIVVIHQTKAPSK